MLVDHVVLVRQIVHAFFILVLLCLQVEFYTLSDEPILVRNLPVCGIDVPVALLDALLEQFVELVSLLAFQSFLRHSASVKRRVLGRFEVCVRHAHQEWILAHIALASHPLEYLCPVK